MSWPIAVWSTPMFEPSRSRALEGSDGGTRSTYCSPTAETLFTVAVNVLRDGVSEFSRMSAMTLSLDNPTDSTRPMVTPRVGDVRRFRRVRRPPTKFAVML